MSDWPSPSARSVAAGLREYVDVPVLLIATARTTKPFSVPANQRVRLDDHQQLTPADQPRQRDQRDASRVGGGAWLHLSLEIQRQLLPQKQILRRQLRAR